MNHPVSNSTKEIGSYKKEAEALLRNSPSLAKIRKKRIFKLFFKMSLVEIAILGLTEIGRAHV